MSLLVFEHGPNAGVMRLGKVLRDYGHRLRVIRTFAGEMPPIDLDDVDGIISMGGVGSANDDLPWLDGEMVLIRQAHELQLPVLGICLGSQIVARALGGTVGPLDGGIEFGWAEVHLTDVGREDVIHAGLAWNSLMFHWHREHVTELPTGARLLASSKRCRNQTWAVGIRTYGIQYHPELERDTVEQWLADDPQALDEADVDAEQLSAATEKHFDTYVRLTTRMFESIALLLMPVDRRYRGVAKDLHH